MSIKIILILLIVLILWRIIDRYHRKQIRLSELFAWGIFWLLAAGFVLWPDASQRLADFLGVGRGVDLIVYLGLLLVFYLLFRIFVKFEKIERDITKITRKIALDEAEKENEKQL
jgi:small membrane protein